MPASPVLDSFALLAFLRDEPGVETVASILEKAGAREQPVHMTEVNYAEVQYIVRRKDGEAAWGVVAGELVAMPIQFHPSTVLWPTLPPTSKRDSNSVSPAPSPRHSPSSATRN